MLTIALRKATMGKDEGRIDIGGSPRNPARGRGGTWSAVVFLRCHKARRTGVCRQRDAILWEQRLDRQTWDRDDGSSVPSGGARESG